MEMITCLTHSKSATDQWFSFLRILKMLFVSDNMHVRFECIWSHFLWLQGQALLEMGMYDESIASLMRGMVLFSSFYGSLIFIVQMFAPSIMCCPKILKKIPEN